MFFRKNAKKYKAFNSRRYKRLTAPYLVKYRRSGSNEDLRIANLKDISSGGMRFYTYESLPKGTSIEAKVLIPPDCMIEAIARILYTRQVSASFHHISVSFTEMPQSDQKVLAQFVRNIAEDKELYRMIDQQKTVVFREKRRAD